MWELIKNILRGHKVILEAIDELDDLPGQLENLKGVLAALKTIPGEIVKALADGNVTPEEFSRIEGRLNETLGSADLVIKEIEEAVEATLKAYRAVRPA
ncbi:MAG: hypothetical protein IH888_04260 [Planctomycetes bacterium]|nr:hypothetical protein [Planctomycetota bacterium]